MQPPPELVIVIQRLARGLPELSTPDGCLDQCCVGARVTRNAIRGARILHLLGSKQRFPRAHPGYWDAAPMNKPDRYLYHSVARIGPWVIDLTRRQLDSRAPYPHIQHIRAVRREWHYVGERDPL